jgi:hypothetical protein
MKKRKYRTMRRYAFSRLPSNSEIVALAMFSWPKVCLITIAEEVPIFMTESGRIYKPYFRKRKHHDKHPLPRRDRGGRRWK